ncbi:putative DNA binding domain-containing protein [Endozoicomonas sp. Mp262]|uniref:RNA-binding domain-containing protein n=1 Tax=Endozoicomonas sp. Mp262 TaxID=2919499 RepID=UPI0021D90E1D
MTSLITSTEDIASLRESYEVEFKLAGGKDGKGEVPKDIWKSYSAMANTEGGEIFLGIREKPVGVFSVVGIANPDKVITDLWNTLNSAKVSVNLLSNDDISAIELDGKTVIRFRVPRAGRLQKPVFINSNPMQGTFRRFNEGDHQCDPETVKRMMAEQVEDNRDARVLKNYDLNDLDMDCLERYRQRFQNRKPDHPFNNHDNREFLRLIGGWKKDRETGVEGLTLAGLLMFGQLPSILDAAPNYFLDYQEQPEAATDIRWVDRVTTQDGTWSGNLFDFYHKIYAKLSADLKVPFKLKQGQRKDETPVHEALREALVNTLAHADYSGGTSILIVKRPDMFEFRNPGGMRIPIENAIQGGESDCRNSSIHKMFFHIGLGEKAGSGIPKIFSSWASRHWRQPRLYERLEPEQTLLELRMIDLFPESVMEDLSRRFGEKFRSLERLECLILATASVENVVNHSRLGEICTNHPRDITEALQRLVKGGFLQSKGRARGTVYFLAGTRLPTADSPFMAAHSDLSDNFASDSDTLPENSDTLGLNSDTLSQNSDTLSQNSDTLSQNTDTLHHEAKHPDGTLIISNLKDIDGQIHEKLLKISAVVRETKRLPASQVEETILKACQEHYLSLRVLAELLNRKPDGLRQKYLNKMVNDKRLRRAFPTEPNSPKQAYTSAGAARKTTTES